MVIPGLRGISIKEFGKRLFNEFNDDDVLGTAAQLSYFFLFSLFPLLFFLVALTAYLPIQGQVDELLDRVAALMPREAMQIVRDHISSLVNNTRPRLLSLGLALAIWSASRGVDAFRNGLNGAYGVKESRPWWRIQLRAITLTFGATLLLLLASAVIVLGGALGQRLADAIGLGGTFKLTWALLRWPLSALLVMSMAALCYYVLPDVKQEFKFITPGSVVATLLWLLVTFGFTKYAERFGNYNATYGSIGGVIVLLTWLYLSSVVFLLGGEINAIIEHATAEHEDEGKLPGQRADPASQAAEGRP